MPFIESAAELSAVKSRIPAAPSARIAIVRPTSHFEIVTGDNPDMQRTLEQQKAYISSKFQEIKDELTDEERQLKTEQFQREFQQRLSKKAEAEQTNFLQVMKKNGILMKEILEDRGHLESGEFDYFTDQIFATDTGQFYHHKNGLAFIPANFKNKQRQGEERLATEQAKNLGAIIQPLIASNGEKLIFEGGDIRQMPGKKLFFIGQGHRSDPRTSQAIADVSGYYVLPIKLLQEQFYHLDCCFLPLVENAAVIYEGEYELNDAGESVLDAQGWPKLVAGTETMAEESRALIRTLYSNDKLILINKSEALAFATNAALLRSSADNRFKLFVNGDRSQPIADEKSALESHQISFTTKHIHEILKATNEKMDIEQVPYSTMHGSGGSVRCTVQEVACRKKSVFPHKGKSNYFFGAVERLQNELTAGKGNKSESTQVSHDDSQLEPKHSQFTLKN